jgi:protein-disulfide isomerase
VTIEKPEPQSLVLVSALAFALLAAASGARAEEAAMSVPPSPISTNPADSPVRTFSGNVFESDDPSRPPALGPNPAKVVVLVFSDFQCPVCRRSADAVRQIPEEFPGEVRVEFWQRALASHASAENAAVASLAAQRQGKFWEYHDELFRNQSALDAASLSRTAAGLGLDVERFERDYQAPELRERVRREGAAADTLQATSTPTFLINGKLHVGWGSWAAFRSSVERELTEARRLEAAGTPTRQIAEARARTLIDDAGRREAYVDLVLDPSRAGPAGNKDDGAAGKPDKKRKKKRGAVER